jgi:hypothetical protein
MTHCIFTHNEDFYLAGIGISRRKYVQDNLYSGMVLLKMFLSDLFMD